MPADYILTDALSPLARHIIARLNLRQCRVVGIDRPEAVAAAQTDLPLYAADIRDPDAMREIFRAEAREYTVVIHCAERLDLTGESSSALFDTHCTAVNHILDLCREQAVRRLVYVGSALALAETDRAAHIREPSDFGAHRPRTAYGQCIAAACSAVTAAANDGLDCVIALPSECVAPVDATDTLASNRLIRALSQGSIRFGVGGGLELVDVRDAAQGVLLAADKGISGRTYILSGRYMPLRELFTLVHEQGSAARKPFIPLALAKLLLPAVQAWDGERPFFNARALDLLQADAHYSHARAGRELGYAPRSVGDTVAAAARFEAAEPNRPCLPPLPADAH